MSYYLSESIQDIGTPVIDCVSPTDRKMVMSSISCSF